MHPEFLSVGAATQASLVRLALGASQNYAAGAITSYLSTNPALVSAGKWIALRQGFKTVLNFHQVF